MHSKKIIISVTNDLVTDQRVDKIATTLHNNGYNVLLIGRVLPASKTVIRNYATKRIKLLFSKKVFFYAEYNIRLFFILLFSRADIFLSNDTDTLLANFFASRIRRKKLVFDAHEMFPEVPELVTRPTVKKAWTKIENFIFPRLKNCYTVCHSIANIYNQKYGINMQVIRNVATYKPQSVSPKINFQGKKILLYQGAVNMGRGIEWVIDAMPYVDNAVFCIIGGGDCYNSLKNYVDKKNLNEKVVFYNRIPFEELYGYTISADLGISLLENKGLNYYYSLPNRIFDFIHAEVPVLATDFPEIRNVVDTYQIGSLVSDNTPQFLAKKIQLVLTEWENKPNKHEIFSAAKAEFCWENEEQKLLEIFRKITL